MSGWNSLETVKDANELELLRANNDKPKRVFIEEPKDDKNPHRILHTVCLCCGLFTWGWIIASMGPTFPDIRLIVKKDLKTASWIFTGFSLGNLIGAVSGGLAYDRLPKIRLFVTLTFSLCMSVTLIPWCQHFAAMVAIHVVTGILGCMLDVAATADIVCIWRHQADVFMQLLHTMFCVGAIISPFVATPFLAEKLSAAREWSTNAPIHTTMPNTWNNVTQVNQSLENETDLVETQPAYGESRIYISYLIASALCFITTVLFVIVCATQGNIYGAQRQLSHEKKQYSLLSRQWKVIFTGMLAVNMALYLIGERGMSQYLMTFLISKHGWSKNKSANGTAVFWIAITLGRLLSVFMVRVVSLSALLLLSHAVLATGGITLWLSQMFDIQILVWLAIGLIGIGMAPIFAASLSWLSEHITKLTGKMTSMFFLSNSLGSMAFPPLLGYLMETFSTDWFVYFEIIVFVCMNCLNLAIVLCHKTVNRSVQPRSSDYDITAY